MDEQEDYIPVISMELQEPRNPGKKLKHTWRSWSRAVSATGAFCCPNFYQMEMLCKLYRKKPFHKIIHAKSLLYNIGNNIYN